jgi:hypothetical protein
MMLGPHNYEQQDKAFLRMDIIDEQIGTTTKAFLGQTLDCARCHDHKFDPLTMGDYYGMAGIFGSTEMITPGNVSGWTRQTLGSPEELALYEAHGERVAELKAEHKKLTKKLNGLKGIGDASMGLSLASLKGVALDSDAAQLMGNWTSSTTVKPFVGEDYQHTSETGARAEWRVNLPRAGEYEVRVSYTAHPNRAKHAGVTITHAGGSNLMEIDQTKKPTDGAFVSLGVYHFKKTARVRLEHAQPGGSLIADAVHLAPVDGELEDDVVDSGQALRIAELDERIQSLADRLEALEAQAPAKPETAMAVAESKAPGDEPLHIRGQAHNLGEAVPRGFVEVMLESGVSPVARIAEGQSGRRELAEWIGGASNPLTARVYVNRVWQHLMGVGLVSTPDNFGTTGAAPTHPELLDDLAARFVEEGWSTKWLIRQIVGSRVYRLGLTGSTELVEADPDNTLLGRAHRRRLGAEPLRDAMLAVSGELDLTAGGLTIRKIEQYDLTYMHDSVRRSVYVPAFRASVLEMFDVFDGATPNVVTGKRPTSTLPTQALFMMNNGFVIERAEAAAHRLLDEMKDLGHAERVEVAYLRTLGRAPTARESRQAVSYIEDASLDDGGSAGAPTDSYAALFHALFASTDFRYLN